MGDSRQERYKKYLEVQHKLDMVYKPSTDKFCLDCGECCRNLKVPCPHFENDTNKCLIHGSKPLQCVRFACDKVVNDIVRRGKVGEWNKLLRELEVAARGLY